MANAVFTRMFSWGLVVYPRHLSPRLISQSGVFTLHGGKRYETDEEDYTQKDKPLPVTDNFKALQAQFEKDTTKKVDEGLLSPTKPLLFLSREVRDNFLGVIKIPSKEKSRIRTELFEVGIHQGSLYTNLDDQSAFVRQVWGRLILS